MNRRGPFLAILAVAMVGYITYLRGYSGVLSFVGAEGVADVLEYRPRDDSGDWIMRYRFESEGVSHEGSATFARKVRPPEGVRRVPVKYLSWAPSVSGVAGYISATGIVAYLVAVWVLWRGMKFWRDDAVAQTA